MTLLIADDHPIFRKGLKELLQEIYPKAKIIETKSGNEALEQAIIHKPDYCILDISMPEKSGIDVCKELVSKGIPTTIIILTTYKEKEMIRKAMLSGASGYVLKENASEELIDCIDKIANKNEKFVGPALQPYYDELKQDDKRKHELTDAVRTLSQSELKTLKLVRQGYTTKKIAELLFLSEKTIENCRSRICLKLSLPPRNNSLVLWINENKDLLDSLSEF